MLEQRMNDAHAPVRVASMKAYADLAGMNDLPALLRVLQTRTDATEIEILGKAAAKICIEINDASVSAPKVSAAMASATPEAKTMLAKILKRIQK